MSFLLFFSCVANLALQGPPNSDIYITKDHRPTQKSTPKQGIVCEGKGNVSCTVKYFSWNQFYYGVYEGKWADVSSIQNEVKAGPLLAGLFFWPAWAYAYGPIETKIRVEP
jgi:hypothetical protein